jgi:hypothetical protein
LIVWSELEYALEQRDLLLGFEGSRVHVNGGVEIYLASASARTSSSELRHSTTHGRAGSEAT